MTVAELIEKLKKCDPDRIVKAYHEYDEITSEIFDVHAVDNNGGPHSHDIVWIEV